MKETILLVIKDYAICENDETYITENLSDNIEHLDIISKFDINTKMITLSNENMIMLNSNDLIATNDPKIINRIKPKYGILITDNVKMLNNINKDLNVFQINSQESLRELISILYKINEQMWNEKGECLCY